MKSILSWLLLSLPCVAVGQAYTKLPPSSRPLAPGETPLYRALADTARKPAWRLTMTDELSVVGKYNERWCVVKRDGFEYFMPTSRLASGQLSSLAADGKDAAPLPIDETTRRVTYTEVVQAPDVAQAELYARARLWYANTFKSSKAVLQVEEKEAGVLQGSGWQEIQTKSLGLYHPEKLWYTVKIVVKDGRFKFDITDFQIEAYPTKYDLSPDPSPVEDFLLVAHKNGTLRKISESRQAELALAAQLLTASIKAGMSKPAAGTSGGKTDW